MFAAIVSVWALLVGISLLMMGSGLQGSLLGVRASVEDFSALMTGVVMSSYYAGFVLGSVVTPRLISRVGHIRVFGALASIASAIALMHAVFVEPIVWSALRVLTGFCYIGLFIVAESWINDRSTNENRGQLLSIYMMVMTGAMATGPLLLNLGRTTGYDLFILASVL
ncbi:MAG: MFS transporter, partial [Rhodospirillaceae bacterium]|nr:MFS transporter [Rhodospirillaceae bacterium]